MIGEAVDAPPRSRKSYLDNVAGFVFIRSPILLYSIAEEAATGRSQMMRVTRQRIDLSIIFKEGFKVTSVTSHSDGQVRTSYVRIYNVCGLVKAEQLKHGDKKL